VVGDGCLFEFMPVEDRVYFIRKYVVPAEATGTMPKSLAEMLHAIGRLIDEYSAFQRTPTYRKEICGGFPKMSWSSLSPPTNDTNRSKWTKRSRNGPPVSIEWA
jgi:hypothetical protein